jgi:hypothetical protein
MQLQSPKKTYSMKKNKIYLFAILFTSTFLVSLVISCVKQANAEKKPVTSSLLLSSCAQSCDSAILGDYYGSYVSQFGSGSFAQFLKANNFTDGSDNLTNPITSSGGYWHCCDNDSIKITSLNSINSNYYYFAGKFSANGDTISGAWKNLTTPPEAGTFQLIKQ